MTLTWRGSLLADEVVNLGPLALVYPLLQQLDVAAIIDRHLPPDPQLEFSHGQVLSLLMAARLCQPTALVNIPAWADRSGADILWNVPADKLNDDRLGRALDAFFDQRHSILASVTVQALHVTELSLDRLHFDTTHLIFYGSYNASTPRPTSALQDFHGDAQLPPAHITNGYLTKNHMIQVGVTSVVDDRGALPIFSECLDGNRNGHTGIREQYQLLCQHLPLPDGLLLVSDRGTFSAEHVARLQRNGHHVLCSVPWNDYRALYDQNVQHLNWHTASYRSIEQQRRRDTNSSLPLEEYRLAVLNHTLTDPTTQQPFDCRVIFVHSTADAKECRQRRAENIAQIRAGLEAIAVKVQRAHPRSDYASIARQVARLLGKKAAARYFRCELVPLTPEEQVASPSRGQGFRPPTHRFVFTFDADAAQTDERYDGLSALVTTAPKMRSGDALFTEFKQQNYVELGHHQFKTPLAVRPVFLKTPRRVEALVCLLQLALQIHQVLERRYRQTIRDDAPAKEYRMTAESLLKQFQVCALIVQRTHIGRVVNATRLTSRQRQILHQLSYPTPAQILTRTLDAVPTG